MLTFDAAGSADDVEAESSARALVAFLQARGYFDARVTFDRQRLENFDRIVFQIDAGPTREVTSVTFAGANVIPASKLADTIATKESGFRGSLFGTNTAATAAQLDGDAQRITNLYRSSGYREAQVRVTASPTRAGLDSAAFTAALVLAEHGRDLFVRFVIDEGQATLLTRIAVDSPGRAGAASRAVRAGAEGARRRASRAAVRDARHLDRRALRRDRGEPRVPRDRCRGDARRAARLPVAHGTPARIRRVRRATARPAPHRGRVQGPRDRPAPHRQGRRAR